MTEQSKVIYPEKQSLGEAKFRSINLTLNLLRHNSKSPLKKGYENTLWCARVRQVTTTKEGKSEKTSYCKNRWCAVCERIRMGLRIKGYQAAFDEMKEPYFLTLTKRTVEGKELLSSIELMYNTWRKILKSKEARRRKIRGIRKAECTLGKIPGHYHFHFHVLIDNQADAVWLYSQWLKEMGNLSSYKGQDIKPADKGSLVELLKYFSKEEVKTDVTDYKRIDVIFRAIRGKRVIQAFGGIKEVKEHLNSRTEHESDAIIKEVEDSIKPEQVVEDWKEEKTEIFIYKRKQADWVNEEGNLYCGFNPDKVLRRDGTLDKGYRTRNEFKEVADTIEVKSTKVVLDPAVWLDKWPHNDIARNIVGSAEEQPMRDRATRDA